jgi:hypothetical protein
VEANISQPGVAEISDQRANAPRLCASGNFGFGYAGLVSMRAKNEEGLHMSNAQASFCKFWRI